MGFQTPSRTGATTERFFSSVDTSEGLFVFFFWRPNKNLEFSSIVSLWLAGGLGFRGSFWQQRSTRGSRFPIRFCYSPNRVGALTHGPHGPTPVGGCVFEPTRPTVHFLGVFMRFWEITNSSRMMTKLGRRSTWCKTCLRYVDISLHDTYVYIIYY